MIIISFSTRGDNWSLLALKLSSKMSICISRKSLSLNVLSNLMARAKCSLCSFKKSRMTAWFPLDFCKKFIRLLTDWVTFKGSVLAQLPSVTNLLEPIKESQLATVGSSPLETQMPTPFLVKNFSSTRPFSTNAFRAVSWV